jgi:hypothetical protein
MIDCLLRHWTGSSNKKRFRPGQIVVPAIDLNEPQGKPTRNKWNDKLGFVLVAMLVIAIFASADIPVNGEVRGEITNIEIVPTPPLIKNPIDIMITVKNTGTESGEFRVKCECSDFVFERGVYPATRSRFCDEFSLDPNRVITISINGTLGDKGEKTIFFTSFSPGRILMMLRRE